MGPNYYMISVIIYELGAIELQGTLLIIIKTQFFVWLGLHI